MKIISIILILVLTITLLLPQGCTKDTIVDDFMCEANDRTTYDDVRLFLNTTCGNNTTCHATGGVPPDYTSYETMLPSLTVDRFENQVITNKSMPPGGELDSAENYLIRCWIEGGYLEE